MAFVKLFISPGFHIIPSDAYGAGILMIELMPYALQRFRVRPTNVKSKKSLELRTDQPPLLDSLNLTITLGPILIEFGRIKYLQRSLANRRSRLDDLHSKKFAIFYAKLTFASLFHLPFCFRTIQKKRAPEASPLSLSLIIEKHSLEHRK